MATRRWRWVGRPASPTTSPPNLRASSITNWRRAGAGMPPSPPRAAPFKCRGAGKSRLATRLANRFQAEGYRVVALRAREEDRLGFGLRLVTEAADACYELGLERHEKMLRDGERALSERLRLLVKVLGEAKILL